MGLGSFVNINIFVMKYYFIQFVYILNFFESLKSKSTQMLRVRPKNGNSGVLSNDTVLNFGLWGTKQRLEQKRKKTIPRYKLFQSI